MKLPIAILTLILLAGTAPFAVRAQEASAPAADSPPSATPADDGITIRLQGGPPKGEDAVDEALLRYLASRGDRAAANAEIERLKKLHPDWQPPTDLFGGKAAVDVSPLWQLYETGDYAAVRAKIAEIQKERPDFVPPEKLISLMAVNEARAKSEAAAGKADWAAVLATLNGQPAVNTCENIDNLWRLAEAQKRTGDGTAAMATYTRIITTCPSADNRFATLQKAKLLVSQADLERLVGLEKARGGDAERLAKVEAVAAKPVAVAAATGKPARPAGPNFARIYRPGSNVADARAVADQVVRAKDGAAARKIGWIYQTTGDTAAALPWFQRGQDWAPGTESAQGLAQALAKLGRNSELDALAARYPAIVTQVRGGQVAVAMQAGDLPTVLRLTRDADKPDEMLMRSWTLMRLMRPTEAQLVFAKVMRAPAAVPDQRDEAVYGTVRAQIAQHLFQDAAQSIERYGLPPDRLNEVQAELLSQEVQVAFKDKDYRRSLALLEKRRDYALPDRGLEVQEAWSRYHMGETLTAKRIFTRLDHIVSTPDTEAGLNAVDAKLGPGR